MVFNFFSIEEPCNPVIYFLWNLKTLSHTHTHTRMYLKVSGLAAWRDNCKWYSSLQLGAVVCESV